jgi:arginyl-tRNA synthetase
MLKQENGSLIVFDLDEWTGRSGNTGPYMMYAYARTRSILREAGQYDLSLADWALLSDPTEEDLLLHLSNFQKVVQKAGDMRSPHLISSYIYDLSKKFNKMYAQCPVLKAETPNLRVSRLALVEASGLVIQGGLALLGIHSVERM